MTSEQDLSLLVSNLKPIKELLALALTATIILWIMFRAGSAHFIREGIWRMLGGSKEFQNEHLNKKWNEVKDLESINYKTGIRFKNLTDACKAFFWIEKHNIPFHELAKAAKYFDPENTRFKALQFEARENAAGTAVVIALLGVMALCFSAYYFSDHAFLLVKETNTRFMTDGITATPWMGSSWHADLKSCKSGATGIPNQHDAAVICSAFDEEGASFIQNTINSQKKFALWLLTLLLILLYQSIRKFDAVRTAKRLSERTNSSSNPTGASKQ